MTTTVTPPEPPAPSPATAELVFTPQPVLSIAANLLPPEVVMARRTRKVRKVALSALCGFVTLLAVWYGIAAYQTSVARDDLRAAEREVEQLNNQQKTYDELVTVQAEAKEINTQLTALLASDLPWSELVASIQHAAPGDVHITGVTGVLSAQVATGRAGRITPTTSVGTVTINGRGASKGTIASYVDALGKVPGLANPFLGSASEEEDGVKFTVRVDITGAALGGRYTTKTTDKAGK
jgi:Tfp pilus assembly protein PilN